MRKRVIIGLMVAAFVLAALPALAEDALYWYKKGNETAGDYEKQVEYYTKAIELAPNWAYAYNNRGVAYFNLGMWMEAKADWDKAVELKPGYRLAVANRAGANFNKAGALMEVYEGSYQDRLAAGF